MSVTNRMVLVAVLAAAGAFYLVGGPSCVRAPEVPDIFYSASAGCAGLASSSADDGLAPEQYVVGDLNGSGHVDVSDLLIFSWTQGKSLGDPGFNPEADLNCDNTVDGADLLILAQNWGI
jgi:hypothetical protein